MKSTRIRFQIGPLLATSLLMATATLSLAQEPTPGFNTKIPESIMTPDTVKTRIGTLKFFDGIPTKETSALVYNNLDFLRGVETFLNGIPAASVEGMRLGTVSLGATNSNQVVYFPKLMDSTPLFLTGNTSTVYAVPFLDLKKDGPTVVEIPAGAGPGTVNDAYFRFVIDMGAPGPDKGKGGKYLILPPDYKGDLEGPIGGKEAIIDGEIYFVAKSTSYVNWIALRGFLVDGKPDAAAKMWREGLKIYPLAKKDNPPKMEFISASGKSYNTVHANNYEFYEELHTVIDREPVEMLDPELRGLFASIGIQKGKPFAPDARMKKILTEAVAVANATARSLLWDERNQEEFLYEGSYWKRGYPGNNYQFLKDEGMGGRNLNARSLYYYFATVNTPAMAMKIVGAGSQYAWGYLDADGNYLDGGQTYKLNIPKDAPAKKFWSVVVYDPQTRSELQTDQPFPSKQSQRDKLITNEDGSIDLYFGPRAPAGKEANWTQTVPGKGWFSLLRLYSPTEAWFEKTWRPGEFERVSAANISGSKKSMAPGLKGSKSEGATAIKARLTSDGRIAIYGISFDTNEADVKPESMETIKNIAQVLQENPELKIAVVGHTDSLGSHEINMRLSKLRADAVVRVLQNQHKISGKRLLAAGAGFLAPVASNDTAEGRALNRRVELIRSK